MNCCELKPTCVCFSLTQLYQQQQQQQQKFSFNQWLFIITIWSDDDK